MSTCTCVSKWRKLISKQQKCVIHIFYCFLLLFSVFKKMNSCFKQNLQPFFICFDASIQVDEAHFRNICTHFTCGIQREWYVYMASNGKSFGPKSQSFFFKIRSTFFDTAVKLCSSIKTIIFSLFLISSFKI